MKLCQVCGNEIPAGAGQCRFCDSPQRRAKGRASRPKERVRTVVLKSGLPTVQEGCMRLEAELLKARQDGVEVLRIIHGWGSGGSAGRLREGCRGTLNRKKAEGLVKLILRGEDYSGAGRAGKDLLNRYGELRGSERADSGNPGITIVVM